MATAVGVELLGGQNWLALPHGSVALPWHQNPAGHGLQRALVTSVALASYVPCGHGCFLSQYGCAAASARAISSFVASGMFHSDECAHVCSTPKKALP